jgi:transposase
MSVAIAPDGTWLATASTDKSVRVWAVAENRTVAVARTEGALFSCVWVGAHEAIEEGTCSLSSSDRQGPTMRVVSPASLGSTRYSPDVTQLLPLLNAVPPVRGRVGRPRRRPDSLFADRGYDHDVYRDQVHARGIVPAIARRGTRHGTGLGTYRWVVERTFAWLHGFRRLRIRWERRADIHEAFLKLACCLITHRQLGSLC